MENDHSAYKKSTKTMNALKEINHIDIQFQTKALMIRYSLIKPYLVDILKGQNLFSITKISALEWHLDN